MAVTPRPGWSNPSTTTILSTVTATTTRMLMNHMPDTVTKDNQKPTTTIPSIVTTTTEQIHTTRVPETVFA